MLASVVCLLAQIVYCAWTVKRYTILVCTYCCMQATYQTQVGDVSALYFRNIDVSDPAKQYQMLR